MDNKITIPDALGQVPVLAETAKTAIEQNERILAAFSKLMEKHLQAEIPAEEVTNKVIMPLISVIQRTSCAAPDVSAASDLIAEGVLDCIRGEVRSSVREVVKDTPINLEHHYTHTTALGLTEYANEKIKNWLRTLILLCILLMVGLSICVLCYYNSDIYWGQQYVEVASSKFATETERRTLWEGIYAESALPKEYCKNPSNGRAKIKQNKKILEQRRRKGKDKNGNYSTEVPLER